MSISDTHSSHPQRLTPSVRRLNPKADPEKDQGSLVKLVEQQQRRIEQLEAILRPLASAETWALAWARENEPWKRIREALDK